MQKTLKQIESLASDFLGLIFPEICVCCNDKLQKNEQLICYKCLVHLPRTNFHQTRGNPVERMFWGREYIEMATSYFFFSKGSHYQYILHSLKYRGNIELGKVVARQFGAELIDTPFDSNIDALIPVPLHPTKERKRGYNQSLIIASGIAETLNKPVISNNLVRNVYTETQTNKGRYDRWENVKDIFKAEEPELLKGKHLLLIDDVVTTGSTLEACASALHQIEDVKVSIATLAYANS